MARVCIAGTVLALLCSAGTAQAACVVTQRAVIPFHRANGLPIVPVVVNGMEARFLLDTGAERSIVTQEAAQRLDLARDEWVATSMRGVSGGIERQRNANPRSFSLGGVALRRRTIARDNSLVVATLPTVTPDSPIDGLLGRDFLATFDLALDFRAETVTLYDVQGCTGRFLPWTGPYVSVPIEMPMASAIVVPVQLDGVPLRAILDTGASTSLIAAPGMFRLGLTPDRLRPNAHATGVGTRLLGVQMHRFTTLLVGSEVVQSPVIAIAQVHLVPIVDMLLGEDWLGDKSVWISFRTGQLFIAQPG